MRAKNLYSFVGMQVHILGAILSVVSLGGLWIYWIFQYRKNLRPTDLPKNSERKIGLLLFGKKCANGIDGCLQSRIDTCIDLLKLQPEVVVASGGGEPSEASIMSKELLGKHHNIVLEEKSLNTIENLYFSKKFFNDNHVLLVSNCYHMRRINVIAKHFFSSYECVVAPSPSVSMIRHTTEAFYAGWLEIGLWWSKKTNQTHQFLMGEPYIF